MRHRSRSVLGKIKSPIEATKERRSFLISKSSEAFELFVVITVLMLFIVSVIVVIPRWKSYERDLSRQKSITVIKKNRFTFNFLMNSGKQRLAHQNYKGAYSEFKLAKAIYPDSSEVDSLLLLSQAKFCAKEQLYLNSGNNLQLQ